MPTLGTYAEKLPCGGNLQVTKAGWQIQYYFSGPDQRYNGTFVNVLGKTIEQYIAAYADNWSEYQTLKAAIPAGGEFTKKGKLGMQIRVGSAFPGVCLQAYHMPINSQQALDRLIQGYRYASTRAPQIQGFLQSL